MEYNLENIDYRSKLLFGKPVIFKNIIIHPLKIWEISEYSFEKYNKFLYFISFNKIEIQEALKVFDEISLYDFILINIVADQSNEFLNIFLEMFSLILKEELIFSSKGYFFTNTGIRIDNENFRNIVDIIKDQNVIKNREEKITTKKEQDYKEMLRKAKEKHKEYLKATGNTETDLLDIISSLAARHPSLNLFNICELTVYQLLDQFKRINLIDEYFVNIDFLLAGADKKNINLNHWSKKT